MSAAVALQDAIYSAMIAHAALSAAVGGRIYDNAPVGVTYPYISFGPSQQIEDGAECIDGESHALQIDVWTKDGGSKRGNKAICGLIKAALHEVDLPLAEPYALVELRWISSRQVGDPDESIAHGVVQIEADTEG